MGERRYTIEEETVGKSFIEDLVESVAHLETDEPVRVTVTDLQEDESESGVGADYDEALERACKKLGITVADLDDEIEEEEDDDEES